MSATNINPIIMLTKQVKFTIVNILIEHVSMLTFANLHQEHRSAEVEANVVSFEDF